jgi:hypothetical protein
MALQPAQDPNGHQTKTTDYDEPDNAGRDSCAGRTAGTRKVGDR